VKITIAAATEGSASAGETRIARTIIAPR